MLILNTFEIWVINLQIQKISRQWGGGGGGLSIKSEHIGKSEVYIKNFRIN